MKTIPAGHGPSELPFQGPNQYPQNIAVVMRECQANATTYGAKNYIAGSIRIDGEDFFFYLHNGKPFDSLENIAKLGLVPNETEGQGWAYQGNGLTYTACYLNGDHPQLIICSHTPQEGFAAAVATPNFRSNEWIVTTEESDSWQEKLLRVLGEKIFRTFSVFYIFRIPKGIFIGKGTKAQQEQNQEQEVLYDGESGTDDVFDKKAAINSAKKIIQQVEDRAQKGK